MSCRRFDLQGDQNKKFREKQIYLPLVGGAGNSRLVTAGLLRSDNEQALLKELLLSKL